MKKNYPPDPFAPWRLAAFYVGIGSAPNSHFMTKAAQLGRGTLLTSAASTKYGRR